MADLHMEMYRLKYSIKRLLRSVRTLVLAQGSPGNRSIDISELDRLALQAKSGVSVDSDYDKECPVFLLATGWRTGSTLVQRILATDHRLLLWGEPYGRYGMLPGFTDALSKMSNAPIGDQVFSLPGTQSMEKSWIANLYPTMADLRLALQAFICQIFKQPAIEQGFARWGLKEVRLDFHDAVMLHWLFPAAKFLVVTRNPLNAYRSAIGLGNLYKTWPDGLVDNPLAYGRHWNSLAMSWVSAPESFPRRIVRLEDIQSAQIDFDELQTFLELDITPSNATGKKIGATIDAVQLTKMDKVIIRRACSSGMLEYGYV